MVGVRGWSRRRDWRRRSRKARRDKRQPHNMKESLKDKRRKFKKRKKEKRTLCSLTRRDHPTLFQFLENFPAHPFPESHSVHPPRRRFPATLAHHPLLLRLLAIHSDLLPSTDALAALQMASDGAVSRRPPLPPPPKRRAASRDHRPSDFLTYKRRRGNSNSTSASDPDTTVRTHSLPRP
jgi:hypothetical protein